MTTGIPDPYRTTAEQMAEVATAWLDSLTPDQRLIGTRSFDDADRTAWYYTPTRREGLALAGMDGVQQRLAHRLIASGLSRGGYATASTIIGTENILDMNEGWRGGPYPGVPHPSRWRDPQRYYVTLFGTPGDARWGWRVGGHHIAFSYAIVDGRLATPTPAFFGADPAEAPGVGAMVFRPLAAEEDLGRELLHLLDAGQRERAVISSRAPFDLVQSNRPRIEDGVLPKSLGAIFSVDQGEASNSAFERMRSRVEADFTDADREAHRYSLVPKGLAAAQMTGGQRDALLTLIRQYIERMPDELAAAELARIEVLGIDGIHFAWAGGLERRQPHYYRLQGPRFLVEYDNVQNGANHVHAVWRDPEGDFGYDVLAAHYAAAHFRSSVAGPAGEGSGRNDPSPPIYLPRHV